MVTTLDFEKGTRTDEIVDVNVQEKLCRDDVFRRRVKCHYYEDGAGENRPPPDGSSPSDMDSISPQRTY